MLAGQLWLSLPTKFALLRQLASTYDSIPRDVMRTQRPHAPSFRILLGRSWDPASCAVAALSHHTSSAGDLPPHDSVRPLSAFGYSFGYAEFPAGPERSRLVL